MVSLDSVQCPQCGEWITDGKLPGHLVLVHSAAPNSWPDTDEYRSLMAAIVRGMPQGVSRNEVICHGCGETYKVEASHDRAMVMEQKWLSNHTCSATAR